MFWKAQHSNIPLFKKARKALQVLSLCLLVVTFYVIREKVHMSGNHPTRSTDLRTGSILRGWEHFPHQNITSLVVAKQHTSSLHSDLEPLLQEINSFQETHPVSQICQVGFGSAPCRSTSDVGCYGYYIAVILAAVIDSSHTERDITLKVYDEWTENLLERKASLDFIINKFPQVKVNVYKGDPLQTVGAPPSQLITSNVCQLIHIDEDSLVSSKSADISSHLINMAHLATHSNLLLLSNSNQERMNQNVTEVINRSAKEGLLLTSDHFKPKTLVVSKSQSQRLWFSASYNGDKIVYPVLQNRRKLTVVLLGYWPERLENFKRILPHYTSLHSLIDQVLFIWNNQQVPCPADIKAMATTIHYLANNTVHHTTLETKGSHGTEVPITAIIAHVNSMNNRFNVSRLLRTDGLIVVDEDVLLTENLIDRMLKAWHSSPTNLKRIVGLDSRAASKDGRYVYSRVKTPTIIIGKTMLFHRKFVDLYFTDPELVEFNSKHFCEDIAMNALVLNKTCTNPLVVRFKKAERPELKHHNFGLSVTGKTWYPIRDVCVQWMQKHYSPNVFDCGNRK